MSMNFTNENPCNYAYVKAEDDFSFDLVTWTGKVLPNRNIKGKAIYERQNDPNSEYYNIPIKYSLEQLENSRLTFEWFNTDNFADDGSPIEIPIDILEQQVKEQSGFIAPKVFEEIEKIHTKGVNRFAISHVGEHTEYKAYGHFHPKIKNKDGSNHRECHTVVVIMPVNHSDPVTEKVFFNHQEKVDDNEERIIELCRNTASPYETVRGNTLGITMPSPGEYLVVEFHGNRCLHWLENYGTKNEYLCLIAEN